MDPAMNAQGCLRTPLGIFFVPCHGLTMAKIIPRTEYLEQAHKLSQGMLNALKEDDLDVAFALYEERDRFLSDHEPDGSTTPNSLLDQVLELDRMVVSAVAEFRQKLLGSSRQLKTVRDYSSSLPEDRSGGDWGSS